MNQSFYNEIKEILISARNKVYQTANFAMVEAYWNIGKSIIEEQGGNEKAEYGTGLLKELSKQTTIIDKAEKTLKKFPYTSKNNERYTKR